jgi:hypothetical protein
LLAESTGDGGLSLSWTRRSRLGWSWPSGAKVPLGESVEKVRVAVDTLTFEVFEPRIVIPPDELTGLSGSITIRVVQVGDFAQSRPLVTIVTI